MKVSKSIKDWWKGFDTSHYTGEKTTNEREHSIDSKSSFLSFLRQQAELIIQRQA